MVANTIKLITIVPANQLPRSRFLEAGYWLVHYRPNTGGAKTVVIKDLCSTCFLHLSSYVRTTYGRKYLGRGKYKFPTSQAMMNHYYLKWKLAKLKAKIHKKLKSRGKFL